MRTSRRLFGVIAAIALVGAACGSDDDSGSSAEDTSATTEATETTDATDTTEATETTTEETTIPPRSADADLVFWLDETRAEALRPVIEQFADENGLNVQITEVAYDPTRNAVTQSAPVGEGPDIFAGAHDWVGEFVASGIVEPLDLGASASDYLEPALQGVTVDGTLYGLPYAVENVALIRNTDLVPEAPATFEELEEIALGLVEDGTVEIPLAVEIANGAAPYHLNPMYTSFGGYVFGGGAGNYDVSDIGLDSPEGLAAADQFGAWFDSGLLSADIDGDIVRQAFSSGDAPFSITGPWNIPDFDEGGVNYSIEPIPPAGGQESAPFVGVQTFYVSAFSENIALAQTFLLDFVNTTETMQALYDAQPRTPAHLPTFDAVQDDPLVAGFGAAGVVGEPLPNIAQMGEVWGPWQDAYVLISQGTDPETAFTDAANLIRDAVS